jgi:hypothetical protein
LKKPSNINVVSIGLVALLLVGGYLGWKLVPVYWRAQKVDRALAAVRVEAGRLDRHRWMDRDDRVLGRLRDECVRLGVADHLLHVYIAPDHTSVHADYTEPVELLFVGTWNLTFRRQVDLPRAKY